MGEADEQSQMVVSNVAGSREGYSFCTQDLFCLELGRSVDVCFTPELVLLLSILYLFFPVKTWWWQDEVLRGRTMTGGGETAQS